MTGSCRNFRITINKSTQRIVFNSTTLFFKLKEDKIMSELTGLETISIEELEEILKQNQENEETQEEK